MAEVGVSITLFNLTFYNLNKENDPARIPFECSGQQWC